MTTTPNAPSTGCPFTPGQLDYMRAELAAGFPHLTVSVTWREDELFVEAVRA